MAFEKSLLEIIKENDVEAARKLITTSDDPNRFISSKVRDDYVIHPANWGGIGWAVPLSPNINITFVDTEFLTHHYKAKHLMIPNKIILKEQLMAKKQEEDITSIVIGITPDDMIRDGMVQLIALSEWNESVPKHPSVSIYVESSATIRPNFVFGVRGYVPINEDQPILLMARSYKEGSPVRERRKNPFYAGVHVAIPKKLYYPMLL